MDPGAVDIELLVVTHGGPVNDVRNELEAVTKPCIADLPRRIVLLILAKCKLKNLHSEKLSSHELRDECGRGQAVL